MLQKECKVPAKTAIDLFAGGGGLTVGLKRAGFQVIGAIEIEPNAFATYKANHPEVMAYKQDIRTINGRDLKALARNHIVDLIAGCPPCQGFSSLTSKYTKDDPRNDLVGEMTRIIREVRPRVVMMENVPGLAQKGTVYFKRFLRSLRALGYLVEWKILQVADYGVPQSRRRLVLLAGRGFRIGLPDPTHSSNPASDLLPWKNVRMAIGGLPNPITLSTAKKHGGPQAVGWNVIRDMSAINLCRLRYAQPGEAWSRIPKRLRPECHQDRAAGFSNVYGRLSWSTVSPTITGGCTTLSKGRFGHPSQLRTISVREAAFLQTFPSDYIFDSPFMDYVCEIIGNALPCDFAEILARKCFSDLNCAEG